MSYLRVMEVRAKKSLGQHFLTDQDIARRIVDALQGSPVLEVGPGMGVLTKYLIPQLAGQALEPGCVHSRFAAAEYVPGTSALSSSRLRTSSLMAGIVTASISS